MDIINGLLNRLFLTKMLYEKVKQEFFSWDQEGLCAIPDIDKAEYSATNH